MWFFQNPEIILYYFFRIFNLDIFWVQILQKRKGSRYLVPVTPTTVLSGSFWKFTGALRIVWRYARVFFQNPEIIFITGFLLQYLCKWYRTSGRLVNLPIFNSSNKNKAGDINSLWNLLVYFCFKKAFAIDQTYFNELNDKVLIFFSHSYREERTWIKKANFTGALP